MAESLKYQAFISYAHADKSFARGLHRDLEHFRVPKNVAYTPSEGARSGSLGRFFRDDDELAAEPDLGDAIKRALVESQSLIVVCSPASAKSRWVGDEIAYFRDTLGRGQVFAVICEGSPSSAGASAAFPPMLIANGFEPLASDFRAKGGEARREALTRLVAGLCGADYEALKRRELTRARQLAARNGLLALAGLALAATAGVSSWTAWNANHALTTALEARDGQFQLVNENAISLARKLTSWPLDFEGPPTVLTLTSESAGYSKQSSVSTVYWDQCPHTLRDCFAGGGDDIRELADAVVAGAGDPSLTAPEDTVRRAEFMRICGSFVGASEDPLIRACRSVSSFDENLAGDGDSMSAAALHWAIDRDLGVAVSVVESPAYCGSGGCSYINSLWVRDEAGAYRVAGEFAADQFALVFAPDGRLSEVVAAGYGQAGIGRQYTTVDRFRIGLGELSPLTSLVFAEEYPDASLQDRTVPPSLRVCLSTEDTWTEGEDEAAPEACQALEESLPAVHGNP